jgi:hypothetical protein
MSKAERNPPREAAPSAPKVAARERALSPPIFWSAGDDEPKTLSAPIYLVHVSGFDKSGERVPLDCTTLDGLPTHAHELGAKYGYPQIELVARDERGAVVCRVTHRVHVAAPATPAPAPSQVVAAPAPAMDPLSLMLAMNERTDKLLALLISSKDSSNAQIVDAITKMSGARLTDSQELFNTLMKAKTPAAAAPGEQKGELAAYLKGFKYAQELIEQGRELEGDGDDDPLSKMKTMLEVFQQVTGRGDGTPQQQPPLRVVNTEGTPK